ncbi:MAG: hypothetical protein HYY84_08595 [Deltaproteobacteria bacterium]|nr:hypothetical protein [Deltaproteobacteria bacterium]
MPFGDAKVDALIEAFARAGVSTFEDDGTRLVQNTSGRASAIRFVRTQVRNMAFEAAHGAGVLGEALDAIAPIDGANVGVSAFVVAYAKGVTTFGATLTKALLDGQPLDAPARVTFPTLALALFVADLYPAPPASHGKPGDAAIATVRAAATDPCAAINDFLDMLPDILAGVVPQDWGFWGAAARAIIAGFARMSTSAAQALLQQFAAPLRLLAVFVNARALFSDWLVTITPDAPSSHYAVGSQNVEHSFTAAVASLGQNSLVSNCAAAAGLPLPATPEGSKVTWSERHGLPEHAAKLSADAALSAANTATYRVRMKSEPDDVHKPENTEKTGWIVLAADVERKPSSEISNMLGALMGNPVMASLARLFGAAELDRFRNTVTYHGVGGMTVTWHEKKKIESVSYNTADVWGTPGEVQFAIVGQGCPVETTWRGTATFTGRIAGSAPVAWDFANTTSASLALGVPVVVEGLSGTYSEQGTVTRVGDSLQFTSPPAGGQLCVAVGGITSCSPMKFMNGSTPVSDTDRGICGP